MNKTAFLALALLASSARAQQIPNLHQQDQWGPTEKQDFLNYLKSGQQPSTTGSVTFTGEPSESESAEHPAKYLTAEFATDTVFTINSQQTVHTTSTGIGPKLLLGGHIFTWLRYYGGVQYDGITQKELDGASASLSHWQVPVGIELALVPLGTPHTRYVVLRAGVDAHYFGGGYDSNQFQTSLLGWQATYNGGIGYEWQIANTNWRIHALGEGYRAFDSKFFGLGFTGGLAYTF